MSRAFFLSRFALPLQQTRSGHSEERDHNLACVDPRLRARTRANAHRPSRRGVSIDVARRTSIPSPKAESNTILQQHHPNVRKSVTNECSRAARKNRRPEVDVLRPRENHDLRTPTRSRCLVFKPHAQRRPKLDVGQRHVRFWIAHS